MDLNRYGNAENFPTKFDYLDTLVKAVDDVYPMASVPFEQGGIFTPPIGAEIAAIRSVVSTAMQIPWNDIVALAGSVYGLAQAKTADQTIDAVNALADAGIKIATQVLDAVGVATEVADAIPIIGNLIRMVIDWAAQAALTPQRVRDEAKICIPEQLEITADWCKAATQPYQYPVPTGRDPVSGKGGQMTPGDYFRPLFFDGPGPVAKYGYQLPLTAASMWLALCGEETQGFLSRPFQVGIPSKGKKGIHPVTQRRMWALLKNIRACARNPNQVYSPENPWVPVGDDGNAAFSMLQDIVYNEYRRGQVTKGAEGIDNEILAHLSRQITSRWDRGPQCYDPAGGGMGAKAKTHPVDNNCSRFVDLASPIIVSISNYSQGLASQFQDPKTGKWNLEPKTKIIVPKRLTLVLSAAAANSLSRDVGRIRRSRGAGGGTKILLAGGAGALGYYLARRYRLFA